MSIWIERFFVAEHELGQRLGQQRLADARRAGEHKAAGRPLGILQTAAAAAHRLGNRLDRLVLADHRLCSSSSICISRIVSSVLIRVSGMPVIFETTSAITSSSTTPPFSRDFSRHSLVICCFFFLSLSAESRSEAAFSKVLIGDRFFLLAVELLDLVVDLLQIGRLASSSSVAPGRPIRRSRRSPCRAGSGR